MHSISLGPIALPVGPLLLLAALWLAAWLARRLAPAEQASAVERALYVATGLGLLAARMAHVALHAGAYTEAPMAALDLRDGGWHAGTGIAAGLAWLAWRVRRGGHASASRRPLAVGAAAGLAAWLGAAAWQAHLVERAMPALPLQAYPGGASTTLARAAAGRPVVVNLWASWCGPCRQEMPVLAAAQAQAQGRADGGIGFIFVNQGEGPEAVTAYLQSQRLVLREVLLDARASLGPAVGSRGLPTTLFYDARGRLVEAHFGVLNAASLQVRLRRLQATP